MQLISMDKKELIAKIQERIRQEVIWEGEEWIEEKAAKNAVSVS